MVFRIRRICLPLLVLGLALPAVQAQNFRENDRLSASDREIVETTLRDVRATVAEVLGWLGTQFGDAGDWMGNYLTDVNREASLDGVEGVLDNLRQDVRSLERDARRRGDERVAAQLGDIERKLRDLAREVDDVRREYRYVEQSDRRVREDRVVRVREQTADRERNTRHAHYDFDWDWDDGYGIDPFGAHIVTMFGAQPFYPSLPGIRYNRVEGFVLGFDVQPIYLSSSRRSKIYGQLGYAFALDDVRYQAGFETRLGASRLQRSRLGLTLGASYHENTETDDTWKIDQWENSLAAFFFRNDFLDYYETEGWNVYARKYIREVDGSVQVGYRSDDYRSLDNNTNWSLFRDTSFRENPFIDEGRMNSIVVQVEAGEIYRFSRYPQGSAFRAVAEFGDGFGGDFNFNRYLVDGRLYLPARDLGSLSLRGRAGYASQGAPLQKQFTVGGVGTVRAYPQNAFIGNRLLLGNAEFALDDVDFLFTDAQLFILADAAWVGDDFDAFTVDNVIGAAGVGIGFDERRVRLELAWPIDDPNVDGPTLWFRLNPTF